MTSEVRTLASREDFATLRDAWNSMVIDDPERLLGLDGTSTHQWFETIHDAFTEAACPRVIVVRRQGQIDALLPVIMEEPSPSRLLVPTELYGGRNGFLLRRPDPELLATLLAGLDHACPGWTSLQTTLVVGSASEAVLIQTCMAHGYRVIVAEPRDSPYYPILANSDDFLNGVSKDLRQKIKTSARKLSELGIVKYYDYQNESEAQDLLDAVLAVERRSWKHAAGTAISNIPHQEDFYRALFPRALRAGLLRAMVVSINGEPVAYNFGLCRSGVFSSLKISQIESVAKLSPSHLLNLELINRLRSAGVHTYDCMGKPEPHKARWSTASQLYVRRRHLLFNRNFRGLMAFMAYRVRTSLARFRTRMSDSSSG